MACGSHLHFSWDRNDVADEQETEAAASGETKPIENHQETADAFPSCTRQDVENLRDVSGSIDDGNLLAESGNHGGIVAMRCILDTATKLGESLQVHESALFAPQLVAEQSSDQMTQASEACGLEQWAANCRENAVKEGRCTAVLLNGAVAVGHQRKGSLFHVGATLHQEKK